MITKDNFKEVLGEMLSKEEIERELEKKEHYVRVELHIFNAGGFATIESMDFNEEIDRDTNENGNLFMSKDSFKELLEELNIYQDEIN